MSDRFFIRLAPGWALGHDPVQWILYRSRKRQDEWYWQPISYVASRKSVLRRVLREYHVTPTANAEAALQDLPDQFADWNIEPEQSASLLKGPL